MSQEYRKVLAYNLQRIRTQKMLRKEELSLALGFDNSYISKLEKCKINITIDKIELIANYLNVTLLDLFKNDK